MTKEIADKKKKQLLKAIGLCFLIAAACGLYALWCNDYNTDSKSYKESEKVIDTAITMLIDTNEPVIGTINLTSGAYVYISKSDPHRIISMNKDTDNLTQEDFIKAKSIYIELAKVTTLRPILKFKNLENVSFLYPLGYDISFKPLTKLKKLKSLSITIATRMTGFGTHYITVPEKTNLYKKLKSVLKKSKPSKYIFEHEPFDLNRIKKLKNLEELSIETEYAENIKALSKLTNLQTLRINQTMIMDMNSFGILAGLKKLKSLELKYDLSNDIIHFDNFVNLEHIKLEQSRITDINSVANLTKLKTLNISYTKINNIDVLAKLENLEEINISYTQINDITPLQNLTKLKLLNLTCMKITDISPLNNLINLEQLEMANTQITDLESLENLVNLQKLNIGNTLVENLQPLSKLTNLQEVHIYETNISQEQIDELQKALPNLNIITSKPQFNPFLQT